MIELVPTQHSSRTVLEVGFDPDPQGGRGALHVQFHDGQGNLTARGYYKDCPRALFNALLRDRKPGSIINAQLKNRFEWVPIINEAPEIAECRANPDLTLPDVLVIPAEVPLDVDAIQTYIDLQRKPVAKEGLF